MSIRAVEHCYYRVPRDLRELYLLRSAQFVKCAAGTSLLPRLFAHSIYEVEPKVGACLELAEWPGGKAPCPTKESGWPAAF